MGWEKIGTAILLGAMLIFIFPRMRHALNNAPKGTAEDWKGFLLPIALVVGFVVLLILLVKG
ncbi:hypothetical protein [Thiohalophilus sp.]|uniref:hypothetical protein n=1 Tax=Thiohalophilus sp. TaxID=3028392 RepID=UPI00397581AB